MTTTTNLDKESVCLFICTFLFIIFILCLLLGIPITQIYIGVQYSNEITCDGTVILPVSDWLIVQGSTTITLFLFISILFTCGKNSIGYYIMIISIYILNVFSLCWLVIGSINFWKDCPNLQPSGINTFMWVSLILGLFGLLNGLSVYNVSSFNTKRRGSTGGSLLG